MKKLTQLQQPFGLGSIAPNFKAETTQGPLDFYDWKAGNWTLFFSFPGAFTPVCTTDIGAVADLHEIWEAKNIKVIGLSCSSIKQHQSWICDVNQIMECKVLFPIVSDHDRAIAQQYNMLDFQEPANVDADGMPFTHRSVFIIDPQNIIRGQLVYPLSTGRNFDEVVRLIDSLILYDTRKAATPSKWRPGGNVLMLDSTTDEEAKKHFRGFTKIRSYYRTALLPEHTPSVDSKYEKTGSLL
ncbi:hypothetical protein HDV03_001047 [Kappamyces sp. JEL0829]|nr:hypothetical protein HDV03_001047 [Kappamyces sp. JEL0829]